MIHHLTIIGVGLIGGSVAKALRCENAVGHVTGFGRRESTLQRAQALGVIDSWSLDLGAAVEQALEDLSRRHDRAAAIRERGEGEVSGERERGRAKFEYFFPPQN